MEELITIKEHAGKQLVSARDLFDYLGHHSAGWAKWCRKHIVNHPFAKQGLDWYECHKPNQDSRTHNYLLTFDLAKEIAGASSYRKVLKDYLYLEDARKGANKLRPISNKEIIKGQPLKQQLDPLIPIERQGENRLVSARNLYNFLEIRKDFTSWCKQILKSSGLEEGVDYSLTQMGERYAHNKVDYALTLECAKHIAMLQKTEKGKLARKYFIECQQANKQQGTNLPVKPSKTVIELQTRVQALEEDKVARFPYMTVAEYAAKNGYYPTYGQSSVLGKMAGDRCNMLGILPAGANYPNKCARLYPPQVLKEVFALYFHKDQGLAS